ncbi:IS3 family transposase, partial [Pantoea sp. FN0307]|uniref:IS3 family transposase n=1 Tax=Pantoea sp. FN0307 TaxID=3418560 RepID=UPI003CE6771A
FYAWLQQPHSPQHQADLRLTGQIKQFWLESGCVYGYRKIHLDLKDRGQQCGIKAQVGYRSPRAHKGEASIVAPNRLQRQFNPEAPNERWVTDITYIRTHEGWLYLAVVVDLFSRKVIGWSMQPWMTKDIVLNALLMAVWRRNPQKQVLVHSDQGSQYTSHEWQSFLKSHGLEGSMSRRGNCHDNAVAESFFQLLKRERIKKKIYGTREEARSDIFDYIEMFYNSKRRHGSNDQMPPTEYENQYYQRLRSVWIIRGDSCPL